MAKPKIAAAPTFKNGKNIASFGNVVLLIDDQGRPWLVDIEAGTMGISLPTTEKKEA